MNERSIVIEDIFDSIKGERIVDETSGIDYVVVEQTLTGESRWGYVYTVIIHDISDDSYWRGTYNTPAGDAEWPDYEPSRIFREVGPKETVVVKWIEV